MNTRRALTIATVLVAGATATLLLRPSLAPCALPDHSNGPQDADDPFADMIQEGDGLLAQLKAEAAALRARTAA